MIFCKAKGVSAVAAKNRRIGAMLMALLVLGGCGASSGEYYVEKEHAAQLEESGETAANAISNYYMLQTALQNMIRSGRESDSIRISGYRGDLDEDLEAVREYFMTVYPLGVYAVQGIGFDKTRILSEMDISVTIQYRRTSAEIRNVVEILEDEEFERRMTALFRSFGDKQAFSFTWFTDSDAQFMDRIMKSWAQAGECAVGLDSISLTSYPEDAYHRIVEVSVQYLDEPDVLNEQAQQVKERADQIAGDLEQGDSERDTLNILAQWLLNHVQVDEEATRVVSETGGLQKKTSVYTAYGALIEQTAAQSGLVLAAQELGSRLGLDCSVVIGSREGEVYWWLAVSTPEGWLHLDLMSQETIPPAEEGGEASVQYIFDAEQAAQRFEWDSSLYEFE